MKGLSHIFALGLLPLHGVFAQAPVDIEEDIENPNTTPHLQVSVSTQFPRSEIFGVKLVNGKPTEAVISLTNDEPFPVTVQFVGGSLWSPANAGQESRNIRNLTTTKYNSAVPAGESESFTYSFTTELHPADLHLQLATVLEGEKGTLYTLMAFNETVSVVEAPTSFFDPQIIFLYLILGALFAGTSYFIYNTWITTLFPQQKRKAPVKAAPRAGKKVELSESSEGPAGTTGSKVYDESWIPAHHIQRPQAKRVRSGTPGGAKTKARPA